MKKIWILILPVLLIVLYYFIPGKSTDDILNGKNNQLSLYQSNKELFDGFLERYADIAYYSYDKAYKDLNHLRESIQTHLIDKSTAATQKDLDLIKDEWIKARSSYLLLEAFRFSGNPIDTADIFECDDNTENREVKGECEGYMNAWPLAETTIDNYLESKLKSIESITFSDILLENGTTGDTDDVKETDVKVGWHAIEYLLWGKDTNDIGAGNRPYTDLVGNKPIQQARRKYLQEITNGLMVHLDKLRDEWDKNQASNFRSTQFNNNEDNSLKSISNISQGLGKLIAGEIGSERLSLSLSSRNQEDEHSCFSDNTKADFYYDIQGIINIWEGKYELVKEVYESKLNDSGKGLKDLMKVQDPNLVKEISDALIENRDFFCLNLYPSDPNYTTDCNGDKRIQGRFDQVILQGDEENNKLKTVESNFINILKRKITEAGKLIGISITNFDV